MKKEKYRIASAVLVGGRSERMGSPKESVVIPDDGRTFLERICDEVDITYPDPIAVRYISARSGQDIKREGYTVVPDSFEGIGPAGGIASVLKRAEEDGVDAVLFLACDLIRYDHSEIIRICGRYDGEDVLFARTDKENLQPLASIYSVGSAEAVVSMIEKKDLKVRNLVNYVRCTGWYDAKDPLFYENKNEPFASTSSRRQL